MPPLLIGFGSYKVLNGAMIEAILPTPRERRVRY
jgi:hypothetical protein